MLRVQMPRYSGEARHFYTDVCQEECLELWKHIFASQTAQTAFEAL